MPIAALIALLPSLVDGISQVSGLIQRLHAEGRTQTTAEEQQSLMDALSRVKIADANFDDAFGVKE